MLACPVAFSAAQWVYLPACGFVWAENSVIDGKVETKPAPNIEGYWIQVSHVVAIMDWKTYRGRECVTIMLPEGLIHVIGSLDSVQKALTGAERK